MGTSAETASVHWNYTTVLNIVFPLLATVLVWRFLRSGGLPMLRSMNKSVDEGGDSHTGEAARRAADASARSDRLLP